MPFALPPIFLSIKQIQLKIFFMVYFALACPRSTQYCIAGGMVATSIHCYIEM